MDVDRCMMRPQKQDKPSMYGHMNGYVGCYRITIHHSEKSDDSVITLQPEFHIGNNISPIMQHCKLKSQSKI